MSNQYNLLQVANKLKPFKSQTYYNFLHESYQKNDKVYKSTKLHQKLRVINSILVKKREIRHTRIFELRGFLGNAETA